MKWAIVGREYTGKAWIKPTDRMKPTRWGPRHMALYRGVPHACTARRTLLLEKLHGAKLTQPENRCPLPEGAPAQG